MNSFNEYYEKTVKSADTFLSRWDAAEAEMWELTSSHKSLSILIRRGAERGNLLISCIDPVTINGPVRWRNCHIRITTKTLSDNSGKWFLVADHIAGVEVICGKIEVKENVKF